MSNETSQEKLKKEKEAAVQTLDLSKLEARSLAAGLSGFFGRITPDAAPGRTTLTIFGLPAGTRFISVWVTEFALPNNPHAGSAIFYTRSVQLFDDGRQCRVIFDLEWGRNVPAAVQGIFG